MPRATVCSLMNRSVSRLRSRSASGQIRRPHGVARRGNQKRVEEQEVGVRHLAQGVVAEPEGQVEPVEALRREHAQVVGPHLTVVIPGLVERLAGELPHDAAHLVGGPLDDRLADRAARPPASAPGAHGRPIRAARRPGRAHRRRTPAAPGGPTPSYPARPGSPAQPAWRCPRLSAPPLPAAPQPPPRRCRARLSRPAPGFRAAAR